MSVYRIVLNFSSPLRLPTAGRQGLRSAASIGADRLFSFLSIGWAVLFGNDSLRTEIIEPFLLGHQNWCVSDLFPYQNNKAYFPSNLEPLVPELLVDSFRTHWLAELEVFATEPLAQPCTVFTEALLNSALSRHEKEKREGEVQFKSLVSTVSANLSETRSPSIASFCSYLKTDDEKLVLLLSRVLNFMKDEGFGGMRSFGLGHISSAEIFPLNQAESEKFKRQESPDGKSQYLILSNCVPTPAMLRSVSSSGPGSNRYKLGKSGGWIYDSFGKHTGLKKPVIRYFETGSSFCSRPEGRMIDLSRDGHSCFRYGIPFTVAI